MADERARYEPIARAAAKGAGIDGDLFVRQITQESGWASDVIHCQRVSSAGAQGIAQIVARFHPTVNPCDPVAALEYAAQLMRNHLAVWDGDWALALSAYNAGPGATAQGVRGTLDGWPYAETVNYVSTILQISRSEAIARLTGATPMPVTYAKATPPIAQDDPWSCAPTSTRWALTALGRTPGPTYIENLMLRDGIVTREHGLMDASGAQLAEWIGRKGPEYYGSDGFYGQNEASITFDWARFEGAQPDGSGHTYPVLIGGRGWNHWAVLVDFNPSNQTLTLMNPAPGWMGVQHALTRATFDALGPWSAVRVLHPDLLAAAPPIPPQPPADTRIPRARQKLVEAIAILDEPAPA